MVAPETKKDWFVYVIGYGNSNTFCSIFKVKRIVELRKNTVLFEQYEKFLTVKKKNKLLNNFQINTVPTPSIVVAVNR